MAGGPRDGETYFTGDPKVVVRCSREGCSRKAVVSVPTHYRSDARLRLANLGWKEPVFDAWLCPYCAKPKG